MIKINGIKIEPTRFPDGTSQIWHLPGKCLNDYDVVVTWNFDSEAELLHIAQLKDLLDHEGVTAALEMPYLPYARQDKQISNDATFALYTFAQILNNLRFKRVYILDPHSQAALNLIKGSEPYYPARRVGQLFTDLLCHFVCYPDEGASKKYGPIYKFDNVISAEKKRDQQTGKILKLEFTLTRPIRYRNILVVDDICDGGATFILLARELYSRGVQEVNLFVTHGIFSKGLKPLRDAGIKRIFTAEGEIVGNNDIGIKRYA
jgi:ribose-phosphate pyrophosphokinase